MRIILTGILALTAAACGRELAQSGAAGGDISPALAVNMAATVAQVDEVYTDATMNTAVRTALIDSYISGIDGRLPSPALAGGITPLTKTMFVLSDTAFRDITDHAWGGMELYYDGGTLKRMRMLPVAGETETQSYYYENGKLVMVNYQIDGAAKTDPPAAGSGSRFYFGQEGLIELVKPDGVRGDAMSSEARRAADQLLLEADRFPRG